MLSFRCALGNEREDMNERQFWAGDIDVEFIGILRWYRGIMQQWNDMRKAYKENRKESRGPEN